MALRLAWGAPFTEDDLATTPDDGHRYELIDGVMIVTPAPNTRHQTCVVSLTALLVASAPRPSEFQVLVAPFDVRLSRFTVVEPDVLVARKTDLTEARLEGPPLLAVEVQSASTRRIDLGMKRSTYEDAGVPAYWLVNPDVPSLTALRLRDWRYVDEVTVTGYETYEADYPFTVTVVPTALLEG